MSFDLINKLRQLKDCPIMTGVSYSVLVTIASFVYQSENAKKLNTACYPTVQLIAENSHFCTKTVKRHITKLKGLGLLHLQRCPQSNNYLYTIKLKAVEKLKETLRLESPRMSPRKDSESPRIVDDYYKINNYINYINNNTEHCTRIEPETHDESSKQPDHNRMLLNTHSSNLDSGCGDDIDRKLPDGKYLDKMENKNMEDDIYWQKKEKNPEVTMAERAGEILAELNASRRKITPGCNLGNERADKGIIAVRLEKLVKAGYTLPKAIDLCKEVIKYWHNRLTEVLTGEYQKNAIASYCADKVFRSEEQFDKAVKNLVNDKFSKPGKLIKFDEEKRKREWEKAKENDIEYKRLLINKGVDELAWINEKDIDKKTELMSVWHRSCSLVEQYELNFMQKRGHE